MGKFLSKLFDKIKLFLDPCRTPSTNTTRGLKEARRRPAASEYFTFFASSAEERTAVTTHFEYDWASVSDTYTKQRHGLGLPYSSDTQIGN